MVKTSYNKTKSDFDIAWLRRGRLESGERTNHMVSAAVHYLHLQKPLKRDLRHCWQRMKLT